MTPKELLRKVVPSRLFRFLKAIVYPEKISVLEERLNSLFLTYYQGLAIDQSQRTAFRNAEFKVYSKHGCDGLLLYIFSKIGVTNSTFVEMGIEDGTECNTANLSLNFGWKGMLIEANKEWAEAARRYYSGKLGSKSGNVRVADCFVTAENIDPLLSKNGIGGEIDLLSIDIDSNDYWVWKSIEAISPRVVVIEYNAAFGDSRSLTIKYDPDFYKQKDIATPPLYAGASLSALAKLGKEKGYTLVACDTHGHDAYFVRNDVVRGIFEEVSPEEAFYPNPFTLRTIGSLEIQYKTIEHLDFVEI